MIPVNEPILGQAEKEALIRCIDSGWISCDGPAVRKFEEKFSSYIGQRYGVAVCNGTAALEASIQALGLKNADEVIMPVFTIISCALAIVGVGAKPVLVDVEPDTWNIDVAGIKKKITKKTKAIMPVHIYGHPVDMDPVIELARKYKLYIIEDAAEAHGAEYKGKKCGSFADAACFSFYANKIITTGEGGMVLTSNERFAERLRSLRNLCFRKERRFFHTELGHNYRMTNIQAALGLAQLERIDEFIKIKRRNAVIYTEKLKNVTNLQLPIEKDYAKNVYWMYGVVLKENAGMDASEFSHRLFKKGVITRPFFLGMHQQPVFRKKGLFKGERYPISERIAKFGLYLPSGLTLREEHIEKVCKTIKDILG